MPAIRFFPLAGLALGAALISGCSTTGMDAGVEPVATTAFAGEPALSLPETVAVLPSSFAGPSPSASVQVAALEPQDTAPAAAADAKPAAAQQADKAASTLVEPNAFASPPSAAEVLATVKAEPVVTLAAPAAAGKSEKSDAPRGEIDTLIAKYAALYEVPEALVRRVVKRESTFNPMAYNHGHWGLMQIKHATARGMGYLGPAKGLLDAETNLKFAVKYLRGAWMVAEGDQERADRLYQRGYYYDAKRMGLLDETGLGRDRKGRTRS